MTGFSASKSLNLSSKFSSFSSVFSPTLTQYGQCHRALADLEGGGGGREGRERWKEKEKRGSGREGEWGK